MVHFLPPNTTLQSVKYVIQLGAKKLASADILLFL